MTPGATKSRLTAAVLAVLGLLLALATPAQAVGGQTISGKVFLPSGASSLWLGGISVTATGPTTQTVPVDPTTGNFSLAGLPNGDYILEAFGTPYTVGGTYVLTNVVPEYFGGSYIAGEASTVTVAGGDVADRTIQLDRGGILRGGVYLPGGWPAAALQGVRITADGPGGVQYRVNPDPDGSYVMFGMAPGTYKLRADPVPYAGPSGTTTPNFVPMFYPYSFEEATPLYVPVASSDQGQQGGDFSLAQAQTISGTVHLEEGSDPALLAGVVVKAHAGEFTVPPSTSVNPATGDWSITGLPGTSYQLEFTGAGLITQWYNNQPDQDSAGLVEPFFSDVTGLGTTLVRARTLSGAITLAAGANADWLAGVRVHLYDSTGGELTNTGVDPGDHRYTFNNLQPGTYTVKYEVLPYFDSDAGILVAPNLVGEWFSNAPSQATATSVDLTAGSRTDVDAALAVGLEITGTATYPLGTSDAIRSSSYVYATGPGDSYYTGTFDSTGTHYTIPGLVPGEYTVNFGDNGVFDESAGDTMPTGLFPWVAGQATWTSSADVTLTSGNKTVDVDYRAGHTISGDVDLAEGVQSNWMHGVFVSIWNDSFSEKVKVDPDTGNFTSPLLPPGDYRVQFDSEPAAVTESPGYVVPNLIKEYYKDTRVWDDMTLVTIGNSDVTGIDATLSAGRAISGTVTVPNGFPAAGYQGIYVYAYGPDGDISSVHPGDSGAYSFRGLVPGSYIISFEAGDYTDPENNVQPTGLISKYYVDAIDWDDATPVDVTVADQNHVDIGLEMGGFVSGHITLPDGSDPDWYRGITVTANSGSRTFYGDIDDAGDYLITGLPVGDYQVYFHVHEYYHLGDLVTPDLASVYYAGALDFADATPVAVTAAGAIGKDVTMQGGGTPFTEAPTPGISGVASYGATLATVIGTWLPSPDSVTFQWNRNGSPISGATDWQYTVTDADLGKTLTVTTTASRVGFITQSKTSGGLTAASPVAFSSAPVPTITGSKVKGGVLTAKPGTWVPTPAAYTYQWYRSGTAIAGAVASTYKLTTSDASKTITVKVTASKGGYASTAKTSAGFAMPKFFTTTPTPTISGTLKSGYTLTAKAGTWSPKASALKYQWYRSGTAISKATKSTYKLTTSDRGKTITVKVTGSLSGYGTVSMTSAGKAIPRVFSTAPTPKIGGTLKSGHTLSVAKGTWKPTPTKFAYQWFRSGKAIKGATHSTYKLTASDKGKKVTVKVTASKSGYVTAAKTSAAKSIAK